MAALRALESHVSTAAGARAGELCRQRRIERETGIALALHTADRGDSGTHATTEFAYVNDARQNVAQGNQHTHAYRNAHVPRRRVDQNEVPNNLLVNEPSLSTQRIGGSCGR
jgi:uncharacterized glyoxalase superfamily metalloenzyme YdcJ